MDLDVCLCKWTRYAVSSATDDFSVFVNVASNMMRFALQSLVFHKHQRRFGAGRRDVLEAL